jgi:16S rRNA (guanine966-N2)-methyltransferase
VTRRGVRVIAGRARGRRLLVPAGDDVRPTKDIVREAVFSALDARGAVVDAAVLDLYAGSGALGIEALSRGARHATFVESDRAALAAIEHNLELVGFDDCSRVVRTRVMPFLADPPPKEAPFDLILADPPYELSDVDVSGSLRSLAVPGWLGRDALLVVERPAAADVTPPAGFRATWERTFGDTLVLFLAP